MTITLNGTTGITSTGITETSDGKVGIGTSLPLNRLTTRATGNDYSSGSLSLESLGGANATYLTQTTPGDFYISNGGGADHIKLDSAGRVTMPYQPVFSGNRVGLSQIVNVAGTINFTPVANQGSHWNTSTNTFTCPVAGKYFVSFYNLTNGDATTTASSVFIKRNGSGIYNAYTEGGTSTSGNNYWNSSISGVLDCQASDTITFDLASGVVYSGQYAAATVYLIG